MSDSKRPELKDDTNKKVIGKFKDECESFVITEVLALNPKIYSFKYSENLECTKIKNKKTLKGVSKITVKNEITHDAYLNVLTTDKKEIRNVCSIRSFNHQLFTFCSR